MGARAGITTRLVWFWLASTLRWCCGPRPPRLVACILVSSGLVGVGVDVMARRDLALSPGDGWCMSRLVVSIPSLPSVFVVLQLESHAPHRLCVWFGLTGCVGSGWTRRMVPRSRAWCSRRCSSTSSGMVGVVRLAQRLVRGGLGPGAGGARPARVGIIVMVPTLHLQCIAGGRAPRLMVGGLHAVRLADPGPRPRLTRAGSHRRWAACVMARRGLRLGWCTTGR
jgi:hypothetical protein